MMSFAFEPENRLVKSESSMAGSEVR
jgi:hypothetical protein